MRKFRCLLLLSVCFGAGCSANSGVIALGNDSYIISKQAATGFSGTGSIKSDALNEAASECRQRNQAVKIEKIIESEPPYILGNYPKIEITFQCVENTQ